MFRRLAALFVRVLAHRATFAFASGAIATACFANWWQQIAALLGTSQPVRLGLVAAAALGFIAAITTRAWRPLEAFSPAAPSAIACFALAAWGMAAVWLVQLAESILSHPGVIALDSGAWNAVAFFGIGVMLLGIPACCVGRLAIEQQRTVGVLAGPAWFLIGASGGIVVWSYGLAQILGTHYFGILAAVAAAGLAIASLLRHDSKLPGIAPDELFDGDGPERDALTIGPADGLRAVFEVALPAGLGGLIAAECRLLQQLVPSTIYLVCSELLGLLVGAAAGLALVHRRGRNGDALRRMKWTAALVVAAWSLTLLAGFPLLTGAALWFNSYLSATPVMLAARGALAGLALFPAGLAAAVWSVPSAGADWALRPGLRSALAGGLIGFCAVSASAFQKWGVVPPVVAIAWGVVVLASACWLARRDFSAGRARVVACMALIVYVTAAPLWSGNFDPGRSARMLFNTQVFMAYRDGMSVRHLPWIDEGRRVSLIHGDRGEYTVWKYAARQLQLRENGIPRGVVSTDTQILPRHVPELLQVALPLVLHDRPERLLLLGLGSGDSLAVGLAFPLQKIACFECDPGLVRAVRNVVFSGGEYDPFADDRVRLAVCEPALALAADPGEYDVIVSNPDHAALLSAQPYFTAEFYTRAARRLTPTGVFCQRLQYIDLGPRPVRAIVRTLQSVFSEVLALEAAPGEVLLAATNDPRGLVHPKLTARLELPHVRGVLAESGLDWSIILNLGAFAHEGLEKFADEPGRRLNTAADSRLAFSLPREVMRWGNKLQEIQATLGPHASRLAARIGDEGHSPVLVRRLAEIKAQQDLMTKYASQYWAYRATVRSQVVNKPRSQVRQATALGEQQKLHPEDARRLNYFKALARAINSRRTSDIPHFEKFETPYDPLLSYFLHQEAAELYARAEPRDAAAELRHRLHATFFSSPRDASLHNVLAAVRLLIEHPAAEPGALARYDDLNALLQALEQRWQARVGTRPKDVSAALDDIDSTMQVVEEAFATMESLAQESGVPAGHWAGRRSALERILIRPVKAYRAHILPHLNRQSDKSEEESESPLVEVDEEDVDEIDDDMDGIQPAMHEAPVKGQEPDSAGSE